MEAADRLLALEEPESSALVAEVFADEGIRVVTGADIQRVDYAEGRFTLRLVGAEDVSGDQLFVATGRRPDLAALGVSSIGLDERARAIPVDGRLRAAPGVWAVGDVTGKGAFTHVSMYQARIAVADILGSVGLAGETGTDADYHALPRVTFTDPEIGAVGMTEAGRSFGRPRGTSGDGADPLLHPGMDS